MYKEQNVNSRVLIMVYIYLSLPIVIFALGWCKWYIAFPLSLLVLISVLLCIREHKNNDTVIKKLRKVSWKSILLILLIITAWVALSGVGGLVWQNDDHWWRNAIFDLLVEEKWPIIRNVNGTERGFIYYIGYWLPSALVGKVFGRNAGYFAQYIWAVIGIVLLYSLICEWKGKVVVWPLVIFVFFGGLDVVGTIMQSGDIMSAFGVEHLERWIGSYQYSSFTTQLFWVFNQAIPAWLACTLIFTCERPRNMVYTWSLVMITSTLPFIGLLPYVIYYLITRCSWKECTSVKKICCRLWCNWCSIQNVLAGGMIGIVTFLYLLGNISGSTVGTLGKQESGCVFAGYFGLVAMKQYARLAVFWFLEAGVFLVCLRKKVQDKRLYYITTIWLLIVPLVKVGESIDFCMRASIPALFLIYMWCVEILDKKKDLMSKMLIVILVIGATTAMHEIARTVVNTLQPYEIISVGAEAILTEPNFSGEVVGFFWKYLAK